MLLPSWGNNNSASLVQDLKNELTTVQESCHRANARNKGDTIFLVSAKWWQDWLFYVGGKPWGADNVGEPSLHPGPVDNSPLLVEESAELKPGLSESRHYATVPEDVWDLFVKHYGVSTKWPAPIRRKVIPSSCNSTLNMVEIYPLKIELRLHTDLAKIRKITCSRVTTIVELMKMARKLFEIPETKDAQFWYRKNSQNPVECLTLAKNGDDNLQKLWGEDGSLFILETRFHWMEWESFKSGFEEAFKFYDIKVKQVEKAIILPLPPAYVPPSNDEPIEGNLFLKGVGIKGLCGLVNLGNTCFMNSAIQCLSNIPDLTEFFLTGEYKKCVNRENKLGTKGELVDEYATLIEALWSGKYSSVTPRAFKTTVGRFAPRFVGYAQQDSTELMSFVLEGLHEDLNQITSKPYYEIEDKEQKTDLERGQEYWDYHKKRNASKIVDLFHGQLKSTLTCNTCQKVFVTFDPFCYLSVPLPKPNKRQFSAHFRYADPSRPVVSLQLTLPLDFTTKDIREAFAAQTEVPADRIKTCVVSKSQTASLTHFFSENVSQLYANPAHDDLMGFEVTSNSVDAEQETNVSVVLYVKSSNFAKIYPFLLTIPQLKVTSAELHSRSLATMNSFRKHGELSEVAEDEQLLPLTGYQLQNVSISGIFEQGEIMPDKDDDSEEYQKKAFGRTLYILIKWDFEIGSEKLLDFDKMATPDFSRYTTALLDKSDEVKLGDCVRLFLNEEQLSEQNSWYCPRCKDHQRAFKKLDLWRLPPYLIIHLKRFDQQEGSKIAEKMDSFVRYPLKLDLAEFLPSEIADHSTYDLVAVSNHFGSISFGHYTAYAINETTGKWYLFDDSIVETVSSQNDVISDAGYLLVYKRHEADTNTDSDTDTDMPDTRFEESTC